MAAMTTRASPDAGLSPAIGNRGEQEDQSHRGNPQQRHPLLEPSLTFGVLELGHRSSVLTGLCAKKLLDLLLELLGFLRAAELLELLHQPVHLFSKRPVAFLRLLGRLLRGFVEALSSGLQLLADLFLLLAPVDLLQLAVHVPNQAFRLLHPFRRAHAREKLARLRPPPPEGRPHSRVNTSPPSPLPLL